LQRTLQRVGFAVAVCAALCLALFLPVRAMSSASAALPAFSYPFSGKPLTRYDGGTTKQVGTYNFPVSQGLAGVYMTLEPGALREMHWHALRNTFDGPTDVLVVFNDGAYESINLNDWLATNPTSVVANNLQIPVPLADQLPRATSEFAPAR
jgi:oxalate decarboxylase/phosphoglucose isomerase-like protein (cupin superfamily)